MKRFIALFLGLATTLSVAEHFEPGDPGVLLGGGRPSGSMCSAPCRACELQCDNCEGGCCEVCYSRNTMTQPAAQGFCASIGGTLATIGRLKGLNRRIGLPDVAWSSTESTVRAGLFGLREKPVVKALTPDGYVKKFCPTCNNVAVAACIPPFGAF